MPWSTFKKRKQPKKPKRKRANRMLLTPLLTANLPERQKELKTKALLKSSEQKKLLKKLKPKLPQKPIRIKNNNIFKTPSAYLVQEDVRRFFYAYFVYKKRLENKIKR